MPFQKSTQSDGSAPPPLRLQRRKLQDLLADHPEGFIGQVYWFHDVRDDEPQFDRVVVGFYDEEKGCSYTGAVVLSADDVAEFKKTLGTVWNDGEVFASLKAAEDEGLPTLSPAEKPE